MKNRLAIAITLGIALLGHTAVCAAHDTDDYDDQYHSSSGTGQNIGKTADNMGQEISKNASTMGQNAAQGASGMVYSVGQFLQGLGTNMNPPAQKPVEPTPPAAASTPATTKDVKTSDETDIATGYENAAKKTTDQYLSCPTCGQKFQVTGFPKGSKAYCPACGKPIEQQQ